MIHRHPRGTAGGKIGMFVMASRRKLLLVDDDDAVIDYLHAKLGTAYDVVSTNSPDRVLSLARSEHPDLIICDIDMPEMDGGDVSSALFDDDELREIPVLFLTALVSRRELTAARSEIGGRPAIAKDAPASELLARIKSLLRP